MVYDHKEHIYRVVLLVFVPAATAAAADDTIEGHWEGALVREATAQIIKIDFTKRGTAWQGTLCGRPR